MINIGRKYFCKKPCNFYFDSTALRQIPLLVWEHPCVAIAVACYPLKLWITLCVEV